MARILQYSLVKLIVFSFLVLGILTECSINHTNNISINILKNKYNLEDLCNGIELTDIEVAMIVYPLYDLNNQKVETDRILFNHDYQLIVTSSPYLCGGCQRANIELVNYFAKEYPDKVFFVIEDWYLKDTMENIEDLDLNKNLILLLDKEGKNISRLKMMNENLNSAFYCIVDKENHIKYFWGNSYNKPTSDEVIKDMIAVVQKYLG